MSDQRATITIHTAKCLSCKSLVRIDGLDNLVDNTDCHFNSGNKDCPAVDLSIVVAVPTETIINNVLKYEEANEFEKARRLYAKLDTLPIEQSQSIMVAISAERSKRILDKARTTVNDS